MADEIVSPEEFAEAQPGPSINLANLDLNNLLKNLDLKTAFKNFLDKIPDNEENAELRAKTEQAFMKYDAMSDEEKAAFGEKIKEQLLSKLSLKLDNPEMFKGLEEAINNAIMYQIYLVAAGVIILILVVFFGYKLYKSLKAKELKREEKKKAKELKKKK